MDINEFIKFKKLVKKVTNSNSSPDLLFKEIFEQRLLEIFAIGDFYSFIFDIDKLQLDFIDEKVKTILGYNKEFSIELLIGIIHPDDLTFFFNCENAVVHFFNKLPSNKVLKYKVRYDFRIRKVDGTYIRILHQSLPIQVNELGGLMKTMVIHTDISHIKKGNKSVLSFIGLDGEPSYMDFKVENKFKPSKAILSSREKDILLLLIEGNNSIQVSEKLYISKFTVDRHRNNMLAKTNTHNISALITKSINEGWI